MREYLNNSRAKVASYCYNIIIIKSMLRFQSGRRYCESVIKCVTAPSKLQEL
jgi:hypothetical protein